MKKFLCAASILALSATAALAAPGHHPAARLHPKPHRHVAASARLVCPVTGTKIPSIKAAFGHSVYKGKTYYFCCPECKPKFDKNPQHYVTNAAHGKYDKM